MTLLRRFGSGFARISFISADPKKSWIFSVWSEYGAGSGPLFQETDPRIRIQIKMKRIHEYHKNHTMKKKKHSIAWHSFIGHVKNMAKKFFYAFPDFSPWCCLMLIVLSPWSGFSIPALREACTEMSVPRGMLAWSYE